MALLLLIPVVLLSLAALLFVSDALERRSSVALVRMALRSSNSSPELTESLVAAELADRLERAGLGNRTIAGRPGDARPGAALAGKDAGNP